jgi:hypothetical protein
VSNHYQSTEGSQQNIEPKGLLLENPQSQKIVKDIMNLSIETFSTETIGGFADRRGTSRFPMREEVRYKMLHGKVVTTGAGQTLNIGSGGVLFTTQERLPVGRTVELSVNWPARLDGTCPLKFVATGRVVRAEEDRAAVRIERYEFRTRSTRQN